MLFIRESRLSDEKSGVVDTDLQRPLVAGKTTWSKLPLVRFFEPSQNALIAWNGQEEILYLTTDVSASRASKVLEVLPLPSQPKVSKGDFKTLDNAVAILNSKIASYPGDRGDTHVRGLIRDDDEAKVQPPAAVIVTHNQIGSHEVSVVKVLDPARFVSWTEANLKKLGSASPNVPAWMKEKIEHYTKIGFHWFAFDVVELQTQLKSIEPLRYRFATSQLFYPLQITRVEGASYVNLMVMSSRPISKIDDIHGAQISYPRGTYYLSNLDLDKIDQEMKAVLYADRHHMPVIGVWQLNNRIGLGYQNDLFGHFSASDDAVKHQMLAKPNAVNNHLPGKRWHNLTPATYSGG